MLGKKLGVLVILSPLFRLADSIMRSCDQRSPINPNRDPLNPPDVESCAGQAPGSNTPVKPHDQLFPSVSPLSSLSKLGESPIKACRAKVLDEANQTCSQGQLLFGNTDHPKRPLTTNSEAGWHLEKRKKNGYSLPGNEVSCMLSFSTSFNQIFEGVCYIQQYVSSWSKPSNLVIRPTWCSQYQTPKGL